MLEWNWGNPLLQDFSNQPQKGYIEVAPDAGIPFRRLAYSDIYDLANASFSLTREEYIQFISWYKFNLRQGSLPFLMYDCRYGINRVARLIGEAPQYQTNSNRYNLSLTIAFEPSVIEEERYLTVSGDIPLLVNDSDRLLVEFGLRI